MRIRWAPRLAAFALVAAATMPLVDLTRSATLSAGASRSGSSIDSLKEDLEEASAAERAAVAQYRAAHGTRAELDAGVQRLDGQVVFAQERVDAAAAEVHRIDGRLEALARRMGENKIAMDQARTTFTSYVRRLYRDQDGATPMSTLLDSATGREWSTKNKYLETVSKRQQESLDRYSALRIDNDELKRDEQRERVAAQQSRDTAAGERDALATTRRELLARQGQAEAAERNEASVLASIRSRKAEFQAEVNKLEAAAQRLAAEIRRRGSAGGGTLQKGNGRFASPINAPITSPYGYRIHPITGTRKLHAGIDFGAPSGSPIRAPGDGVVIFAGVKGGYGNATVIDHGNGLSTLYGHQSRLGVGVGQRVKTGDVIGFVGSTGHSTGAHLHFEVRVNGTPVDPMRYL